ncbi:MAG TPA: cytochrome c [Xanthobacteraceae bacterium]|nr:cytochrome c [Xanthobacteraceae bacterium]
MLRMLILPAAVVAVLGAVGLWFVSEPVVVPAAALAAHRADLGNGQTLFRIGGCVSCHAVPGQDDKTRLGGGLALTSPFGTFYAPNISPDLTDGIGAWTEAQFITALTRGTSPDGRHYYPAFPYTSYQRITTGDARDLFAFMKTLPPVRGRVRDHDLPFPFNVRRGLGVWKLLFLDGAPFRPEPAKSAAWNRGAYLVNGPGHCAECHSARNLLGGIVAALRFAGGPSADGKGWVPNITQHGLKDWSEQDIAWLLETGQDPEGDSVGSSMVEVVRNTAQLSPEDRAAIATYIKSLPPIEGPKRPGKT